MEMIAKKSLLGGLSLVVLTWFSGIVFAMSFRITDTAAHQTIVGFEIHKTLSNLSILTIRPIILTILKKRKKMYCILFVARSCLMVIWKAKYHLQGKIKHKVKREYIKIQTKFLTYLVSYLTHLFFVIRNPAIWPRILWFVNS